MKDEFTPASEPVAHMYPSDLKRFQECETFATAFSVAVGSPDERSEPLYTAEALCLEREAGRRERDAEVAEHEHQCSTHYHAWAQCDCAAGTVTKLRAEVAELVGALEYHQDQTRPIRRTQRVLAKHRRNG